MNPDHSIISQSKKNFYPTASLIHLKQRTKIINQIRNFFTERNVLEVETPLLSHATVTDPYVIGIPAISSDGKFLYLQTSPEFAMKRLLAAGSGAIFQICKAFRQGDKGRFHNPEFTILEWYRPGFDHHDLMNEMDLLLQTVLQVAPAERASYANLFAKYVGVDPHTATLTELKKSAEQNSIQFVGELNDRNAWLDLLLTHCVEPHIGREKPIFIYDFPITQAALAKIRHEENPPVASRFEVYFKGIELANGFHELQNAAEQRKRFENDLVLRKELGLPEVPIDENFIAALEHGLPDCSGVALGVDRLIMLALESQAISDVVSFTFDSA